MTAQPTTPSSRPPQTGQRPLVAGATYRLLLTWAFTLFSSVRVLSYLPTLWLIVEQQNSSQHSLLTWLTWLGANLTMAGWLHEHNGRRFNRAVWVNLANATMCTLTAAVIVFYRFAPGATP